VADSSSSQPSPAAYAGFGRGRGDRGGAVDVDRAGERRVEGTGRIADQARQVDDGIDAAGRGAHGIGVAHVGGDELERGAVLRGGQARQRAVAEQERVDGAHGTAGLEQAGDHGGADIAGGAGDEHGARGRILGHGSPRG
jgi:hypothetical protein